MRGQEGYHSHQSLNSTYQLLVQPHAQQSFPDVFDWENAPLCIDSALEERKVVFRSRLVGFGS